MGFAVIPLLLIIRLRPDRLFDRLVRIFVETLTEEFRADRPPADEMSCPTFLFDRGNAPSILNLSGRIEAVAIGAKCRLESWGEHGAGSREALEDRGILMA